MPKKTGGPTDRNPEGESREPQTENGQETRIVSELEAARREAEEYLGNMQRLQAEFENYRKRMLREQTQIFEMANQSLVSALLPALDSFERALGHDVASSEDAARFKEGVQMVHKQIIDLLTKEGLEPIDPLGEPFDPHWHEAMMHVPSDDYEVDTVEEVFEKGYRFKGKVIRPARVKVSGPG